MAEKKGTTGKMFVWILLGLLILGLGGFGATNFSGGSRSIGSVGDADISIDDYSRGLQNEMNAFQAQTGQPVTIQQAQQFGLTQRVLAQLVVGAALEDEARTLGISVGDARLAEELQAVRAFQGPDGSFSRDTYRLVLENANLSERDFEESLRAESASTLLQGAVLAGTQMPSTYANTLLNYAGERRSVDWVVFDKSQLTTGLPVSSEADQKAWYDENIAQFTLPETKQITYAWLTPEMIVDSVEIDQDSLRAAYDERSAEFNHPERRLVERLVFADDAAAQAAADRLTTGNATFESLVTDRGLELSDTDLGDVTLTDLGAAGDVVFAAQPGEIAGPAPSDLGPALFRVNAALAAQTTSFEEAMPLLRSEQALDRARRVIEQQAQSLDDELAGGATLEELADTTDMALGKIGWHAGDASDIAGFEAFRELAARLTSEDFPAITDLGDGGIFAARLDDITPPTPQPFDEVKDQVVAALEMQTLTDALVAEAETQITTANGDLAALNLPVNSEQDLNRTSFGADLPLGMLQRLFTLDDNGHSVLAGEGEAYLLKLTAITPADPSAETSAQLLSAFGDQAANDVASDLFRALSTDIQNRAGVAIDQAVINAIHANFQ